MTAQSDAVSAVVVNEPLATVTAAGASVLMLKIPDTDSRCRDTLP